MSDDGMCREGMTDADWAVSTARYCVRKRNDDRMVAGRALLAILAITLALWALLIKGGIWLFS